MKKIIPYLVLISTFFALATAQILIAVPNTKTAKEQQYVMENPNARKIIVRPPLRQLYPVEQESNQFQEYSLVPQTTADQLRDLFVDDEPQFSDQQETSASISMPSFLQSPFQKHVENYKTKTSPNGGISITIKLEPHQLGGFQLDNPIPSKETREQAQAVQSTQNTIVTAPSQFELDSSELDFNSQLGFWKEIKGLLTSLPIPNPFKSAETKTEIAAQSSQVQNSYTPSSSQSLSNYFMNMVGKLTAQQQAQKQQTQNQNQQVKQLQLKHQLREQQIIQQLKLQQQQKKQQQQQQPQQQQQQGVRALFVPNKYVATAIAQLQQASNPKPKVLIAKPNPFPPNNYLLNNPTTPATTLTGEESETPMLVNLASTIAKTVSDIPTNLDHLFNDMGRTYRKHLFQLRDAMPERLPYGIHTYLRPKNKRRDEPKISNGNEEFLDGYGV